MIDLSPQPHDPGSGTESAPTIPRHDPLPQELERRKNRSARWHLSHQEAEGAIQFLSRWAGPATLILTLLVIGWLIIG